MRGKDNFTTSRARALRQQDNDAETIMWRELRGRRLNGFKFVRQVPIGKFFADFACREKKLVIEIDGSQHANNAYDEFRDEFMISEGWSVLRFWANEVLSHKQSVLNMIVEVLEGRLKSRMIANDVKFLPAGQDDD